MPVSTVAMLTAGGLAPCLSSAVGGLIERYSAVVPEVRIIAYRNGYAGLLKGDSVAALKVVSNLAAVMSKRLAAINERLVTLSAPSGKKKEELADFGRILTSWQF